MSKTSRVSKKVLSLILIALSMTTVCFAASPTVRVSNPSIDLFRLNKAEFVKVVKCLKKVKEDVCIERAENNTYSYSDTVNDELLLPVKESLLNIFYKLNYHSVRKESKNIWFTMESTPDSNQVEEIVFSLDGERPEIKTHGLSVLIDRDWYYFVTSEGSDVNVKIGVAQ